MVTYYYHLTTNLSYFVIHDVVLLCNLGVIVLIKLFQLIKSPKLKINFNQSPHEDVSIIVAWSQDKLDRLYRLKSLHSHIIAKEFPKLAKDLKGHFLSGVFDVTTRWSRFFEKNPDVLLS